MTHIEALNHHVTLAARHHRQSEAGAAARRGIGEIGEMLHAAGGLRAMSAALCAVEELHPDDGDVVAGIIDHRWDGIGGWVA